MQGGHAVAVAGFAVDATLEQGVLQAQPTQAHRQRQRRIAGAGMGEGIGTALEQFECELLLPARAAVVLDAGAEETGQSAGTGGRDAVAQQHVQGRQGIDAARQQRKQRHIAAGVAHFRIGAVAQQPVDGVRVQGQVRVVQQLAELARRAQPGQGGQAIGAAELQALAQQHQRRAVEHRRRRGGHRPRCQRGYR